MKIRFKQQNRSTADLPYLKTQFAKRKKIFWEKIISLVLFAKTNLEGSTNLLLVCLNMALDSEDLF